MNSPFSDEIFQAVNFSVFLLNPLEAKEFVTVEGCLGIEFGNDQNSRFCNHQVTN